MAIIDRVEEEEAANQEQNKLFAKCQKPERGGQRSTKPVVSAICERKMERGLQNFVSYHWPCYMLSGNGKTPDTASSFSSLGVETAHVV